MAEAEQGVVRHIAWKEIFPWWILVRCFRLAISAQVLILMAVGVTLTVLGWGVLELVLSPAPAWRVVPENQCPWRWIVSVVPEQLGPVGFFVCPAAPSRTESGTKEPKTSALMPPASAAGETVSETPVPLPTVPAGGGGDWWRPLGTALSGSGGLRDWLYLGLAWLWKLAVWAFFGAAVTRLAVVRLASEERLPLAKSLQFASRKWPSYVAAPLFPFLGMFLAGLPIAILGLFLRFEVGVLIAALLWPLALLAGVMIMILLVGLVFGWPLMWTTISAEGTDCFDALSRSYAYVFQRPLRYLFYAVVAGVLGALGWVLVSQFAAGVIQLTYWSAGWGMGGDAVAYIRQTEFGPVGRIGALLIRFWVDCVKLAAFSYLVAYFWAAASAIYLLLRYDVDATEMDEVYLEEEEEQPGYGMPPLKSDVSAGPAGPEPTGPASAPNPQE
ncbi:MAG TPA: hypothetical protein PK777_05210 [Thermoguttaceae bacterium]|nr:hypothetical protein [Thermoguttaceae bacterium]